MIRIFFILLCFLAIYNTIRHIKLVLSMFILNIYVESIDETNRGCHMDTQYLLNALSKLGTILMTLKILIKYSNSTI